MLEKINNRFALNKSKAWHLRLVLCLAVFSLFLLASCSSPLPIEPTEAPQAPSEVTVAVSTEAPAEPTEAAETPAETTATQWNPDPAQNTAVTNLGGDEATPKIVTMDNGDFYIAWFSNTSGNYDVRMQKYNAAGEAQWDENGRLISSNPSDTFITDYSFSKDADSNLILIFQDSRTGEKNIFAYAISPEGDFLWGDDGLQLTDNRGFTSPYPSVVTSANDVAFAWIHEPPQGATQLIMQKLSADGTPLWGDDGLVVPGQEDAPFIQASLVSGGDDQLILLYGMEAENAPQIMSIYAQKYDADGNALWNGGDGVQLHDSVPFSSVPQLISDGNDGAYVAWHSTDLKSFVQHLDADGNLLMAEGGQAVTSDSPNLELGPQAVYAADTDDLFVFWTAADGNQDMHGLSGQKLSATGDLLWDENGNTYIDLSAADVGMVTPQLSADNVIVFYGLASEDSTNQGANIEAVLVAGDGTAVWSAPTTLSSTSSPKQNLGVGAIGAQEWVNVWSDGGQDANGSAKEIVMQNLALDAATQIANPASVFCVEQGGQSEIRTNEDGSQAGVCVFDDGSECDEWAFFRGECTPGS